MKDDKAGDEGNDSTDDDEDEDTNNDDTPNSYGHAVLRRSQSSTTQREPVAYSITEENTSSGQFHKSVSLGADVKPRTYPDNLTSLAARSDANPSNESGNLALPVAITHDSNNHSLPVAKTYDSDNHALPGPITIGSDNRVLTVAISHAQPSKDSNSHALPVVTSEAQAPIYSDSLASPVATPEAQVPIYSDRLTSPVEGSDAEPTNGSDILASPVAISHAKPSKDSNNHALPLAGANAQPPHNLSSPVAISSLRSPADSNSHALSAATSDSRPPNNLTSHAVPRYHVEDMTSNNLTSPQARADAQPDRQSPDDLVLQPITSDQNSRPDDTLPVCPPAQDSGEVDGLWGWVVVAGSLFISAVVDGTGYSVGLLFSSFQKEFGSSKMQTAWVSAMLGGACMLVGPVVSVFVNRYDCRKVAVFGAVLATAAFLLSTLSPNIEVLILLFGLLGGLGSGFLYQPSFVIVGYYFLRRRALALGLTSCGTGIGIFALAPLFNVFVDNYSWRGTTYLIAGIYFLSLCACATFRPFVGGTSAAAGSAREQDHRASLSSFQMSIVLMASERERAAVEREMHKMAERKQSKRAQVKAAQRKKSEERVTQKADVNIGVNLSTIDASTNASTTAKIDTNRGPPPDAVSSSSLPNPSAGGEEMGISISGVGKSSESIPANSRTVKQKLARVSRRRRRRRLENHSTWGGVELPADYNYNRKSDASIMSKISKDLGKIDGDMIAELQWPTISEAGDLETTAASDPRGVSLSFSESMQQTCTLLRRASFLIYSVVCLLVSVGMYVPTTFLPPAADELGISSSKAALLVAAMGVGNVATRVLAGWVVDRYPASSLPLNCGALTLAGLATCAVPLITTFPLLLLYSFVFGGCVGVFVALQVVILIDLLGLDLLATAFGLANMGHGFGILIGPPLAGYVWDIFGDVRYLFYVIGAIVTLSGVISLPLGRIADREHGRSNRVATDKTSALSSKQSVFIATIDPV